VTRRDLAAYRLGDDGGYDWERVVDECMFKPTKDIL